MAVLVEGYSVIINKARALENQEALNALAAVEETLHPMAVCSDEHLLRVGFMALAQANEFLAALENAGLHLKTIENGTEIAQDVVKLTQFGELEIPCPWLSVKFTKLKDDTLICLASLKSEEQTKTVALPKHWSLDTSILKRFHDERTHYMQETYEHLRSESMQDIYWDKEKQKEIRLLKLKMSTPPKEQLQ